jgi:hypothetical protein
MHGPRSRVEMVSLLLALAPVCLGAQQSVRRAAMPPIELRADAIDPRSPHDVTVQGGVGVNVPLGYYVRMELVGGAGVTRRDSIDWRSGRVDALARFLLDPFNESPWGLSIGGGMSVLFTQGARTRAYLVVVTDLEGPRFGPFVGALQLGLGGGVRAGIVMRGYHTGSR